MLLLGGIVVSALLIFFSFPPFPLGVTAFVSLVPVFIAMETAKSARQAFLRTWLFAFVCNSAICYWVAHTMNHFAKVPWVLSYPSVAALSVFEQTSWAILAAIRHVLHKKLGLRPILWTASCGIGLEFLWPKLFPDTVGGVFYNVPLISQLADVSGVFGLTFLIVVTNETIALWCLRTWNRRELLRHTTAATLLTIAALFYAGWRYQNITALMATPAERRLKVAMVQPNVNPVALVRERDDKDQARLDSAQAVLRLSRQAAEARPDLIIWPETAVSNTFHSEDTRETRALTALIDRLVSDTKIPLVFGARDWEKGNLYNAVFLVEERGIQRYRKYKLLWMGEYLPFSDWFPTFKQYVQDHGGTPFSSGTGPTILEHPKAKLGPMICLEGLYSAYVRDIVLRGAEVLVNATNDAWFGPGMEPALHLHLTRFRSIETRRPMVRATTTGLSAIVDIDGSLRSETKLGEQAIRQDEIAIRPGLISPYLILGNSLIWLALIWAAAPFLWWGLRRKWKPKP